MPIGVPHPSTSDQPALFDYHERMGWPVCWRDGHLVLPLPPGWVALAVPPPVGAGACRQRVLADACGPVLVVPGTPQRWVFLAEVDSQVLTERFMPVGVHLVRSPQALPLPPTKTEHGRVVWAVPPVPSHRWLPTASAVLCAVGAVMRHRRTP